MNSRSYNSFIINGVWDCQTFIWIELVILGNSQWIFVCSKSQKNFFLLADFGYHLWLSLDKEVSAN